MSNAKFRDLSSISSILNFERGGRGSAKRPTPRHRPAPGTFPGGAFGQYESGFRIRQDDMCRWGLLAFVPFCPTRGTQVVLSYLKPGFGNSKGTRNRRELRGKGQEVTQRTGRHSGAAGESTHFARSPASRGDATGRHGSSFHHHALPQARHEPRAVGAGANQGRE
nr:MAG TPA: hypothetical protein [Caudoviricetes sp.]